MKREVTFEHKVTAWTVGDLRRVLEGVPDDAELVVIPAEEPGGDIAGETQVFIAGRMGQDWVPPARGALAADGHWKPANRYELETEFPSGTYYRTIEDDE